MALRVPGRRGWQLIAADAVAVAVTGTLAETTLATVTLPAGIMGTKGILRVDLVWSFTNNANNKIMRVKLGTAQMMSRLATASVMERDIITIQNRGVANSQVGGHANHAGMVGMVAAAPFTSNVNTAVAQTIYFDATLAVTTDTITLERYYVEVHPF